MTFSALNLYAARGFLRLPFAFRLAGALGTLDSTCSAFQRSQCVFSSFTFSGWAAARSFDSEMPFANAGGGVAKSFQSIGHCCLFRVEPQLGGHAVELVSEASWIASGHQARPRWLQYVAATYPCVNLTPFFAKASMFGVGISVQR